MLSSHGYKALQAFRTPWLGGEFAASLSIRGMVLKTRNKGTPYVPRKVARATLGKATRNYPDLTLLLPPYVSVYELRIIFRLDYAGTLRQLGIRKEHNKYFWRDQDGRQFETTSKRRILVPFDIAAIPSQALGMKPKMVDVEPDWENPTAKWTAAKPVPVVAVLGHINHGKTTLLDALCGTSVALAEPGGITQEVRAMTGQLSGPGKAAIDDFRPPEERPLVTLRSRGQGSAEAADAFDNQHHDMTFLDTPGHEAFEVQRGRTMAAADVALVVVSVERGAEVQTEEVLLHAARWQVPVVFALNKIDLPDAHIELTRAELRRQCQKLYEAGLVNVDWTREAEEAVPISALHRLHLRELIGRVNKTLLAAPSIPASPVQPPTSTPGEAQKCKHVLRRTDFLVGIEAQPSAVALIVEVERGAQHGERVLTLIVRAGRLMVGQYFVAGTVFGRISHMAISDGGPVTPNLSRRDARRETASVGMAVQIMGMRQGLGGDCAPDDYLFVLPRERAYRLSEHRRRIETLTTLQTAGPRIDVPWEHDPTGLFERTQAMFDRHPRDHPERHAKAAYEQRQYVQPAIEDITQSGPESATFSSASRQAFESPFRKVGDGSGVEEEEAEPQVASPPRGRRSRRKAAEKFAEIAAEDTKVASSSEPEGRRFMVATPLDDAQEPQPEPEPASGGGRRSARKAPARGATGAWTIRGTDPETPKDDFVYYTDRRTWTEEADIDSTRTRLRWQERDQARWEEAARQKRMQEEEKELAEVTRREVFGESLTSATPPEAAEPEDEEYSSSEEDAVDPLPQQNRPVVSMILKAKTMGQFEVLMDEAEKVEEDYRVRVVIVHGGLGPVIPKDVVHAEVEKRYGYCPIYAFQVGVNPVAVGQADKEGIDIRRYDVFTDLVADIVGRCERMRGKDALKGYRESLRSQPTLRV